jgi:hypothetical protein
MAVEIPNVIQALAIVAPAVSPAPGTLLGGAGVSSVIPHAAVGVYTITLDQGAADSQSVCQVSLRGAAGDYGISYTRPDASTVQVTVEKAGAPDDTCGFSLVVYRLPD